MTTVTITINGDDHHLLESKRVAPRGMARRGSSMIRDTDIASLGGDGEISFTKYSIWRTCFLNMAFSIFGALLIITKDTEGKYCFIAFGFVARRDVLEMKSAKLRLEGRPLRPGSGDLGPRSAPEGAGTGASATAPSAG